MGEMTREEKQKRNKELEQKALKRLKDRGQPFFGAAEKDVLQMRIQMQQLIQTNNENVSHIKNLLKFKEEALEKIKEQNYMIRAVLDMLRTKEICTEQEINTRIRQRQLTDMKLVELDKAVEPGDVVTIKFMLKHEEEVIDDRTSQAMRYDMGTSGIPCEQEFIGMKKGERKIIENIVFGPGFRFKEYVGKPLTMDVMVCGVHQKQEDPK